MADTVPHNEPAELRAQSAPLLLAARAQREPEAIAYRAKHLGLYRERNWRDYASLVARCAHGFRALGLAAGERVAIMGDACEEWLLADLGAQAAGAITYGIYPTASPAELEYQMLDGGASIFVAEDQEYVDRIVPIANRLPGLRWIVVIDNSAMFDYQDARLRSFAQLLELGGTADANALERLARGIDPASPAFIVYTSGTTGHPKGALVAHGKHLAAAANLVEHYPTLTDRAHRTVAYLPMCHILGRDVAITLPLVSQLVPHFGEDIEDLPATLFEVAPTVLFAVPRYLQKFAAQVLVGIANTSPLKRAAYDLAMRAGRQHARARWEGSAGTPLAYALARAAVFRPVLNKLGLDQLELLISGGAPLPGATMALWQIWGVNTVEIYGQTETAGGIITGQRGPFPLPGGVGTAPGGWEVELSGEGPGEGEIHVKSSALFEGYWGKPEATREVMTDDGWLRTGDIGRLDEDGFLYVTDRKKDLIKTAAGKFVAPQPIENRLKTSPFILNAVVVGDKRKFIAALVVPHFANVEARAKEMGLTFSSPAEIAAHPWVRELIGKEIERLTAHLAQYECIKRFGLLDHDLTFDGGQLTYTMKLRRRVVEQRYSDTIEQLYADVEEPRPQPHA